MSNTNEPITTKQSFFNSITNPFKKNSTSTDEKIKKTEKKEVKTPKVKKNTTKDKKSSVVKTKVDNKNNKGNKSNKSKFKVFLKVMLFIFLIGLILGLSGVIWLFIYIKNNAPEFDVSEFYRSESTIIYANDGTEIAKLGNEMREIISYEELPEVLIDAIIATEDSRFFQHNGFDLARFISASLQQLSGNSSAGGASTITMQVVYNNFTERTSDVLDNLLRKFTDIYMSIFKIEEEYSKEEILELYVNIPFLGDNSYGVEQACLNYFGKSAKDINLSEAALIAGLFQAPSTYNPYLYPEKAEARRSTVLYLMERHGYISEEERIIANSIPVQSLLREDYYHEQEFQGFIDTVVEEVQEKTGYNPYVIPMKIWTTMDIDTQSDVNSLLNGETFTFENDVVQTAFSITDINTGALIAVGAGRNREGERSYNFATMMNRQPGSTAKPLFDYAPAIEYNNWSTHYQILDDTLSYTNGKEIGNWDGKYMGLMSMRDALSLSRNTPALRTFQNTTNSGILTMATNLGLNPEVVNGYVHEAHSLGAYTGTNPLELGAAFGAFGNGGYYVEPYSVKKIEFRDTGEVYEHEIVKVRAMSEETAYMITSMLVTSVQEGLSSGARLSGVNMAAKTGTTNFDNETIANNGLPSNAVNDLWIVGYSPDYVVSLWYGYEKINNQYYNTAYKGVYRDALYQEILKIVMPRDYANFSQPSGVVSVQVEKETMPAMLPSDNTPSNMISTELFLKGTEPTEVSNRYNTLPSIYNLKSTSNSNKIELTWDFDTPDQASEEYLMNYFTTNLGSKFAENYYNSHIEYNASTIGTITFGIYTKDSNGDLKNIGYTDTNEFTYTVPSSVSSNEKLTFVVIAEYSIIKNMNSANTESSIVYTNSNEDLIVITLKGNSTINLNLNEVYADEAIPVIVTDNGIETTNGISVNKEIYLNNVIVSSLDTSKSGTYIIQYTVTYKDKTTVLKRTINIS